MGVGALAMSTKLDAFVLFPYSFNVTLADLLFLQADEVVGARHTSPKISTILAYNPACQKCPQNSLRAMRARTTGLSSSSILLYFGVIRRS